MQAAIGDRIMVHGRKVRAHERTGVVLNVEGEGGGPPFLVRWEDTGSVGVFYPGSDAVVEHLPAKREP